MKRKLHIYSTAIEKDFPVYQIVAKQLKIFYPDALLYLITPSINKAKSYFTSEVPVQFLDENELVDRKEFCHHLPDQYMSRWPWYYQQMLKLIFPRMIEEASDFLIWDADTIPTKKMKFVTSDSRIILTKGSDIHEPYFETIDMLFGEKLLKKESFIAQHFYFNSNIYNTFKNFLENNSGLPLEHLFSKISTDHELCFSEYETFGNYLLNYQKTAVDVVERRWARNPYLRNLSISEIRSGTIIDRFKEYEFVALEYYSIKEQLKYTDKYRYMAYAGQFKVEKLKSKLCKILKR